MGLFLGDTNLIPASSGGGGGGGVNTYSSFHIEYGNARAIFSNSQRFADSTANIDFRSPIWDARTDAGISATNYPWAVGTLLTITDSSGNSFNVEQSTFSTLPTRFFLTFESAADRDSFLSSNPNATVATFTISLRDQSAATAPTTGYDSSNGIYTHSSGTHLITGHQALQGSLYPNATVTGQQPTLQNINTFPDDTTNPLIRWGHDGTQLWKFQWIATTPPATRSAFRFGSTDTTGSIATPGASIVATPYTIAGTGSGTTYTEGTPITVVPANEDGPFTFVSSDAQGKAIYDVSYDHQNSRWIWFTSSLNEAPGVRIQDTDSNFADVTSGGVFQQINLTAPASTSGSFAPTTAVDHTITVNPNNGDWIIMAQTGRNINGYGVHTVDISNSFNTAFSGNSINTNLSPVIDTNGFGYVADHTNNSGGNTTTIDRTIAAITTSFPNPSSTNAFFSVPSGEVNNASFLFIGDWVTDGNNRVWIPMGIGNNRVFEIADITAGTGSFIVNQALIGDATSRTVDVTASGLSGALPQAVFYQIA